MICYYSYLLDVDGRCYTYLECITTDFFRSVFLHVSYRKVNIFHVFHRFADTVFFRHHWRNPLTNLLLQLPRKSPEQYKSKK